MKSYLIMIPLAILVFGCKPNSSSTDSSKAVEEMVDEFVASLGERSENSHHSNTIFTEGGVFCISTQEGVIGEDGKPYLKGNSRTNGFFILPRMIWVSDKQEAKEILLEDLKNKKGYPIEDYSSSN